MLTKAILEGHRDRIFDQIVEKLVTNEEFEVFIAGHIKKSILEISDPKKEGLDGQAFRQGIATLISNVIQSTDSPIEKRVKSLEQVLFKTSQADRNRLFDHIYEKIALTEKKMLLENERIEKALRRQDKRSEMINL